MKAIETNSVRGQHAEHPSVVVSHPGKQHSYETALAVQNAGMLKRYVTGLYYKPSRGLASMLRILPRTIRSKVERQLGRRRLDHLDPKKVKLYPIAEIIYVAMSRSSFPPQLTQSFIRWRNDRFDAVVARMIEREPPSAVICYQTCALKTFQRARASGVYCILDQPIADMRFGMKLLREEQELHPEFADSIIAGDDPWRQARAEGETLLADRILAGSEFVKQSLLAKGIKGSRISVLPYGADIGRFRPTPRDERTFRVLFVGQLSQRKGIKYLLEAVKQLNLPNLELVFVGGIVGAGKGLTAYRDTFVHVHNVPHHEVHRYFQQSDIFVYPSIFEGSALAIYEALAAGLPVITTLNAGSVVRDGVEGYIVPIRDIDALKERILRLYEDRQLRAEMGRNARKRAEEFTWSAYHRRLASLLHETLDGRTAEVGSAAS